MIGLKEKLERLGWMPKEPRADYDLAVFRVLSGLVDEVERLRGELETTNRVLQSRTEHLV